MRSATRPGFICGSLLAVVLKSMVVLTILTPTSCGPSAPSPTASGNKNAAGLPTIWPQFRGPGASGVQDGQPLPEWWDVETGAGVRWKTRIPGTGHSSPVIAGDRIYLTTAVREQGAATPRAVRANDGFSLIDDAVHVLRVLCVDRSTGEVLWTRDCWRGVPAIQRHPANTHATCTAATDGKRVVAFFGSEGLYCFSMDGDLLWTRDFGVLDSGSVGPGTQLEYGFASSPVIHSGRVIVQCDVRGDSFVAALDLSTGEDLWRKERTDYPTWSTPTVHVVDGQTQIALNGFRQIAGLNFEDGETLWSLGGGGDIPIPTPVVSEGLVFITSHHGRSSPVIAIRANARGRLQPDPESSESVVWAKPRRGAYMPTPIVYERRLYVISSSGVLWCYDAESGAIHYRARPGGDGGRSFLASPAAGDGKLYLTSDDGIVFVIGSGEEYVFIESMDFDEPILASPAIADGAIFFRTGRHLIAIDGAPKPE